MRLRLPSSPRRRRRLAWATGLGGAIAAVALVIALIPSHGHGVRRSSTGEPSVPVFMLPSPAARAARTSAEVAARRIAVEFTARLAQRRELAAAYAQLSPRLRSRYSLAAWRDGNDFPVLLGTRDVFSGFSIAYSSAVDVGLVLEFDEPSSTADSKLVALRLQKHGGRWAIVYVRQGHSSGQVGVSNFAPSGFYPGSTPRGVLSWLPLAGVLVLLIGFGVVLERRASGRSTGS